MHGVLVSKCARPAFSMDLLVDTNTLINTDTHSHKHTQKDLNIQTHIRIYTEAHIHRYTFT